MGTSSTNPEPEVAKLFGLHFSPELARNLELIRKHLHTFHEDTQRAAEQIRQAFSAVAIPKDIRLPSWEEFDSIYRARLKMLADHGWFAAMDFPLVTLNRADATFRAGQITEANEALTELFDTKAAEIARTISDEYPETATLITGALQAHHEADYAVSVFILLSQAGGIWGRHARLSPYSRNDKKRRPLRDAIQQNTKPLAMRAYWELLLEDIPLTRSFHAGDPEPTGLNRHAVIHGHSLHYGTRINSARAFSWLSYVAEIRGYFGLIEEDQPPPPTPAT